MKKILILFISLLMLMFSGCYSDKQSSIPDKPTNSIYVQDNAKILDNDTKDKINQIGDQLYDKYKAQVVVVTIDSLNGKDIESYSNELFRSWGIGDKNKNNGVLLLISKNDKKTRIEVGYGLEGTITDSISGRELNILSQYFKKGHYSEGTLIVYKNLVKYAYTEYDDVDANAELDNLIPKDKEQRDVISSLIMLFLALSLFEQCGVIAIMFLVFLFLYHIGIIGFIIDLLCASSGGSGGSSGGSSGFGGGSSGGGGASGGW